MMLIALSGALILSALPVRVEAQACPSGPEVGQALASMLPSVPSSTQQDVAHVSRSGRELRIDLVDRDAAVIAERSLDVDGSCAELAALAAVVIASWESDVHPEFARSPEEPILATLDKNPSEEVTTPSLPPPLPSIVPPILPPILPSSASYEVAIGPSLSLAGSVAAGGMLIGTWIPRGVGWGLHILAAGESARTIDLGQGQAHWRRWMGSLEPDWRVVRGRTALDFHAGLALGWLSATGVNFPGTNRSQTSVSPGVTLGVRSSWRLTRHLAIGLDLAGLYWTRAQTVSSDAVASQQEIPHFQVLASVGLALRQSTPGQ
jgi:hypothetical protein